jgi:RNA polymerase sigma-70 factor (sigma-E family)
MEALPETSSPPATVSWSSDGYGELFAAHQTTIYRFVSVLCGDDRLAEEITAEVFARVLPKWRRGVIDDPLPYLRRAAVNELRSRWRRRAHERRVARVQTSQRTIPPSGERVELREPLLAALSQLPPRQRAVVVLRYCEDMSEADVATTLAMAPGTVKSQASRGLARLRQLVDKEQW